MNTRYGRSDRIRTCGIDVPNVARYQLRHTPKCEKYSIFRSISVSGQTCGQTAFYSDFEREPSAEKVSVYKGFSSMFARTFKVLLFSAKRSFDRGGVPAGVLLPKHARYQLRYIPKYLIFYLICSCPLRFLLQLRL